MDTKIFGLTHGKVITDELSACKLVLFSVYKGIVLLLNCLCELQMLCFTTCTNRIAFVVSLAATTVLHSLFHQARRDDFTRVKFFVFCFITIIFLGSIVLNSLFSSFYATRERYRFKHCISG